MMEIDKDEVSEEFKEPSVHSGDEISDSSTSKNFRDDGSHEHANPNRGGRRGRKRKQRSGSDEASRGDHPDDCGAQCEDREEEKDFSCENECGMSSEDCEQCEDHKKECDETCEGHSDNSEENKQKLSLSWDSEEELEEDDINWLNSVMVRPTDVPRAPENSTQFIIDDHDECRLYMSFETPNPYLAQYLEKKADDDSEIIEPNFEDDAYSDINYQYESPHDFDNSAYYDREFELSYKNNRFDELLRLSRSELINGLQSLERHMKELNEEVVKEDPGPILEGLQSQLLALQEKNFSLKEQNTKLQETLRMSGVDPDSVMHDDTLKEDHSFNSISSESDIKDSTFSEEMHQQEGKEECVPPAEDGTRSEESSQEKDLSNKENNCKEDVTLQARKESCNARDIDSCKVILRDSEYHESCEEKPLNSVPDELSAVTV